MGAALRFKHVNVPRQQGEQARLKVVHGPDFGAVFVITGTRSTLGRGEENDIMVSDLKASRKHAEFSFAPATGWSVKDMGSANGLLHNGLNTRSASIKSGDTVTFGETTLEFLASETATMMLVAPPRSVSQLHAEHANLDAHKKNARSFGLGPSGATAQGGGKSLFQNPKSVIYLVLAVGVAFLLMWEPPPKTAGPRKKTDGAAEDLRQYLPGNVTDPGTAKTAEQFFKNGFREYMARNYLRAENQFETVLQMAPGHDLAHLYLENCKKEIDEEVKFHKEQGKKALDAGRLKDAKGNFEAILRIRFRDQAGPDFVESKEQLEKVLKLMSGTAEEPK